MINQPIMRVNSVQAVVTIQILYLEWFVYFHVFATLVFFRDRCRYCELTLPTAIPYIRTYVDY